MYKNYPILSYSYEQDHQQKQTKTHQLWISNSQIFFPHFDGDLNSRTHLCIYVPNQLTNL